jgi:putative endonuclease
MRYEKHYYVYILASLSGTLYIGITNNLERRMVEHREGLVEGFTKQLRCRSADLLRDVP